ESVESSSVRSKRSGLRREMGSNLSGEGNPVWLLEGREEYGGEGTEQGRGPVRQGEPRVRHSRGHAAHRWASPACRADDTPGSAPGGNRDRPLGAIDDTETWPRGVSPLLVTSTATMSLAMSMDASESGPLDLLCSVAGCRRPLTRSPRGLVCPRGHSFDVARRGYVTLLQPRDRRSSQPGDAPATVTARLRLAARGFETPLTEAITSLLTLGAGGAVLDVGCGDGHPLAAIVARFGAAGYGLDISVPAIDAAARRHSALHWVVANADRFLPYPAASFRLVASITAQRNPE